MSAALEKEEYNAYETAQVICHVIFCGIDYNDNLSEEDRYTFLDGLVEFEPSFPRSAEKKIENIEEAVLKALLRIEKSYITANKRKLYASYMKEMSLKYLLSTSDEEVGRLTLFREFVNVRGEASSLNWTKVLMMLTMINWIAFTASHNIVTARAMHLLASYSLEFFFEHGVHDWITTKGSGWEHLVNLPIAESMIPKLLTEEERKFADSWVPEDDFRQQEPANNPRQQEQEADYLPQEQENNPEEYERIINALEHFRNRERDRIAERGECSYKYVEGEHPVRPARPPSPTSRASTPRKSSSESEESDSSSGETKFAGEGKFYETVAVIVDIISEGLMNDDMLTAPGRFTKAVCGLDAGVPLKEQQEVHMITQSMHLAMKRIKASQKLDLSKSEFYSKLNEEFLFFSFVDDQAKARLTIFRALLSANTSKELNWQKVLLMLAIIQTFANQISISECPDLIEPLADYSIEFFSEHGVHEWIDRMGGGWTYLANVKITREFIPEHPTIDEMWQASLWEPPEERPLSPVVLMTRAFSKRLVKRPSVSMAKGEQSKSSDWKLCHLPATSDRNVGEKQKRLADELGEELVPFKKIRVSSQICSIS